MIYIQLITSIRVTEETKRELTKIGGELTAKDGIERSMEDILKTLIKLIVKNSSKLNNQLKNCVHIDNFSKTQKYHLLLLLFLFFFATPNL